MNARTAEIRAEKNKGHLFAPSDPYKEWETHTFALSKFKDSGFLFIYQGALSFPKCAKGNKNEAVEEPKSWTMDLLPLP